jgi:hypothetical protein
MSVGLSERTRETTKKSSLRPRKLPSTEFKGIDCGAFCAF